MRTRLTDDKPARRPFATRLALLVLLAVLLVAGGVNRIIERGGDWPAPAEAPSPAASQALPAPEGVALVRSTLDTLASGDDARIAELVRWEPGDFGAGATPPLHLLAERLAAWAALPEVAAQNPPHDLWHNPYDLYRRLDEVRRFFPFADVSNHTLIYLDDGLPALRAALVRVEGTDLQSELCVPFERMVFSQSLTDSLAAGYLASQLGDAVWPDGGRIYLRQDGSLQLAFRWLQLPDGRRCAAYLEEVTHPRYGGRPEDRVAVGLTGPERAAVAGEAVRRTAAAFVRAWGAEQWGKLKAMAYPDEKGFAARSELAWFFRSEAGPESFAPVLQKLWLDRGLLDLQGPAPDWRRFGIEEAVGGAPGRAVVSFPGSPLVLAVYVPASDRVSGVEVSYRWSEQNGNGRNLPVTAYLQRLEDRARAERLMRFLLRGEVDEAAREAGLAPRALMGMLSASVWLRPESGVDAGDEAAVLRRLQGLAGENPVAADVLPWADMVRFPEEGFGLRFSNLFARFRFAGPDGARRLEAIAVGEGGLPSLGYLPGMQPGRKAMDGEALPGVARGARVRVAGDLDGDGRDELVASPAIDTDGDIVDLPPRVLRAAGGRCAAHAG